MKKLLITLSLIMICLFSQAQFQLNGYIDQPISCYGNNDASIQITAYPVNTNVFTSSPINGVLYKNTNVNTQTFSTNTSGFFNKLTPGTYLACAHLNGDSLCYVFNIVEAIPLDIKFTIETPLTCNSDGALSVNITGGTNLLQGYLTWWTNTNGDTLNNVLLNNFATYLEDLPASTYNVAIEDDNGCFYSESYVLWKQGDFNHDSNVDLLDISVLENDINNFVFGENIETDLNKDGNVDILDLDLMTKIFIDCN